MDGKNKQSYMHTYGLLRILTCFSVVFHHMISSNTSYIQAVSYGWIIVALDNILMCNNDLFFMLSGKFALERYDGRIWNYYKNKLLKIVLPMVLVSVLYYFKQNGFRTDGLSFADFVQKFFANGILGYLWFVYVLIGFYLIVPILAPMFRSMKQKQLIAFTALMMSAVISDDICGIFHVPFVFSSFPFLDISTFLLGYLADHIDIKKKCEYMIYAAAIPAGAVSCYMAVAHQDMKELCFLRALMCCFVYLLVTRHTTKFSELFGGWIRRISNQTYYIYLLHGLVQGFFYQYAWNIWVILYQLPFIAALFLASVIIFCMAALVSAFIRITQRGCKRMFGRLQVPEIQRSGK